MDQKSLAARLIATDLIIGHTSRQVSDFVEEAAGLGLHGVCVFQNMVKTALEAAGGRIRVITVTGYPSGIDVPETKIGDAALSAQNGAQELDFGINLSALKSGDTQTLRREIEGVVAAARPHGCRVYGVFNTYHLDDSEISVLAELCRSLGVDGLKTTSGDSVIPRKTQPRDAQLLKAAAPELSIKAEGQIDTLEETLAMLAAGADLVCSSSAFQIAGQAGAGPLSCGEGN